MKFKLKTVLVLFIIVMDHNSNAQNVTKSGKDIFDTLIMADRLLFDVGFNECNLPQVAQLVADDIEFYHDIDGITQSKKVFINTIQQNLCNSGKNKIKRVSDKESIEIFPLYKNGKLYGAVQNGIHSFGDVKANYSHLWLIKKNEWKLSRVLSYNHQQQKDPLKNNKLVLSIRDLKRYVGTYEFSPEFILTVRIKDGKLYGGSQGQEVEITSYEKHKFIDSEQTHDLEFILNSKGKVSSLKMKGSGMEMTGLKTK